MTQVMNFRVGVSNRLCCASLRLFVHLEAAFYCKPFCTFVLTGSMIDYSIQSRDDDGHLALSRCIASLLSYRETSKQDLPEIEDGQRELLRSYLQPSVLRSVTPPENLHPHGSHWSSPERLHTGSDKDVSPQTRSPASFRPLNTRSAALRRGWRT
jgi:hypothetical protein